MICNDLKQFATIWNNLQRSEKIWNNLKQFETIMKQFATIWNDLKRFALFLICRGRNEWLHSGWKFTWSTSASWWISILHVVQVSFALIWKFLFVLFLVVHNLWNPKAPFSSVEGYLEVMWQLCSNKVCSNKVCSNKVCSNLQDIFSSA